MSLTSVAKFFKRGVKWFALVVAFYYLVILFLIPQGQDLYYKLFVDKEPATPTFGLLDPLKFVRFPVANTTGTPQYVLSTKNGRLPFGLPKKMPVYTFKPVQYSYLAAQRAQEAASFLGFNDNELITDLKGPEFKWRSLVSGGVLTIDTQTQTVELTTDLYDKDSSFGLIAITAASAKSYAVNVFKTLGMYSDTVYKQENFLVYLGMYAGGNLVGTNASSEARVARVELIGKTGNYPILGPDAKKGLLSIVLQTPQETSPYNYPIIEAHYWDIYPTTSATYPIITVQEAWKQVSAGGGVISSVVPADANPFVEPTPVALTRVLISNVYLAYYETPEFQKYLQPIYVFEGKFNSADGGGGDITIYYPAVTNEYTKQPQASQPTQ